MIKNVREKGVQPEEPEIITGNLLDITSEPVSSLVDSIKSIYGRKGNNAASGTFDENEAGLGSFKNNLDNFLHSEYQEGDIALEQDEFVKFSLLTMNILKNKIRKSNFATGGYLVFGHYLPEEKDIDSNGFMLVAMVKNKDGIILNNLVPEKIQPVDLSKLHQAVKVNIERYSNFYNAINPEEREFQTYLTFISPKINESSSGYFVDAIGCINAIPHNIATKSAIRAVDAFFEKNQGLEDYRREAKEDIARKLYELSGKENADCTLDTLDSWVNAHIPADLQAIYEDEFSSFANTDPFNVPPTFKSNQKAAQSAMKLKIDAKEIGWKMDFDRNLLGDTETAKIFYDKETGKLILKDLPDNIRADLLSELDGLDNE